MSLEEDSDRARAVNVLFTSVRDAVLEDFPWSFATKRATLAKLAAAPAWGFGTQFQLPVNTIRILMTDDDTIPWRPEGSVIMTDRSSMSIKYTARITDPVRFSSGFDDAFSSKLAYELTMSITGKQGLKSEMWQFYQASLTRARATDMETQGLEKKVAAKELSGDIERPFLDVR